MVQDGVKSRECDQGCENRQVFVQASTRNCRVVVEPEKTLGNRSTRMQCCSPPSKRATDEEEQEDERTLDVRVGRELYGVEGEKVREWWWTITGSQQGQCKFGMVGRRISLQTPPSPRALWPSTLFLALVLFHAVIAFKTSLHASSTPH
jgi:hypothetical protein